MSQTEIWKNEIGNAKSGFCHHAYWLIGESESVNSLLIFLKNEMSFDSIGNADYWYREYERFGVEESHELATTQSRNPVNGGMRIFILVIPFIGLEAQNSLLKVLEDPKSNIRFFIFTKNRNIFIPTVCSRLVIVSCEQNEDLEEQSEQFAEKFISAKINERLKLVELLIKNKDKIKTLKLLDGLEKLFYKNNNNGKHNKLLTDIIDFRRYLNGSSPSVKNILEYLCLVV